MKIWVHCVSMLIACSQAVGTTNSKFLQVAAIGQVVEPEPDVSARAAQATMKIMQLNDKKGNFTDSQTTEKKKKEEEQNVEEEVKETPADQLGNIVNQMTEHIQVEHTKDGVKGEVGDEQQNVPPHIQLLNLNSGINDTPIEHSQTNSEENQMPSVVQTGATHMVNHTRVNQKPRHKKHHKIPKRNKYKGKVLVETTTPAQEPPVYAQTLFSSQLESQMRTNSMTRILGY